MSDADNLKATESGGTKYAPPQAMRLGDSALAQGSPCSPAGSNAKSACAATGSWAQSCDNGLETGGAGDCNMGDNAGNCKTGNVAFRNPPGCHTGNNVVSR